VNPPECEHVFRHSLGFLDFYATMNPMNPLKAYLKKSIRARDTRPRAWWGAGEKYGKFQKEGSGIHWASHPLKTP
jgi:hypothetical protein